MLEPRRLILRRGRGAILHRSGWRYVEAPCATERRRLEGRQLEAREPELNIVDLLALARDGGERKPAWSQRTDDLSVNLIVLAAGGDIPEHTNAEVDVLLIGIDGEGAVEVEREPGSMRAGQAMIIPKGTRRSIRCTTDRFAYLSCHRDRGGLWPDGVPRVTAPRV